MRKKYLGDTWNRIVAAGYGVNYDSDYARNEYKKERGQTIFDYYRERVYQEILEQIINENVSKKLTKKQSVFGISQFVIKVEKFLGCDVNELLLGKDKLMEKLNECLSNLKKRGFINCYEIDGEYIRTDINEAEFGLFALTHFENLRIPRCINDGMKEIKDRQERMRAIYLFHKAYDPYSNDFKVEITLPLEELEMVNTMLDMYDLDSPDDWGNIVCYHPVYAPVHKKLIKSALKEHFEFLYPLIRVCHPNGIIPEKLDEFIQIGRKTGANDTISKMAEKTGKSEDYILDLIVDLISEAYLEVNIPNI